MISKNQSCFNTSAVSNISKAIYIYTRLDIPLNQYLFTRRRIGVRAADRPSSSPTLAHQLTALSHTHTNAKP